MYDTQYPYFQLYEAILGHDGDSVYTDVLAPWPADNADECIWFADFQARTNNDWSTTTDNDLCRLYALFRITAILLLRFQTPCVDDDKYPGPAIAPEDFQRFHEQLGLHVPSAGDYHPFFHEIISVIQSTDDDAPIRIDHCVWPCLMLGDMMFSRAGCVVSGGSSFVVKDVAETSMLYRTFRRRDRRCNDLSHCWGHNSQWRTRHRRDYYSDGRYHFNIDGRDPLNGMIDDVEGVPADTLIELVRNRGLIRSWADDSDLWPYDHYYQETS